MFEDFKQCEGPSVNLLDQYDFCCVNKENYGTNENFCQNLQNVLRQDNTATVGVKKYSSKTGKSTKLQEKQEAKKIEDLTTQYQSQCKKKGFAGLFDKKTEECKDLKRKIHGFNDFITVNCNQDVTDRNLNSFQSKCCNTTWKRTIKNRSKCKKAKIMIKERNTNNTNNILNGGKTRTRKKRRSKRRR